MVDPVTTPSHYDTAFQAPSDEQRAVRTRHYTLLDVAQGLTLPHASDIEAVESKIPMTHREDGRLLGYRATITHKDGTSESIMACGIGDPTEWGHHLQYAIVVHQLDGNGNLVRALQLALDRIEWHYTPERGFLNFDSNTARWDNRYYASAMWAVDGIIDRIHGPVVAEHP